MEQPRLPSPGSDSSDESLRPKESVSDDSRVDETSSFVPESEDSKTSKGSGNESQQLSPDSAAEAKHRLDEAGGARPKELIADPSDPSQPSTGTSTGARPKTGTSTSKSAGEETEPTPPSPIEVTSSSLTSIAEIQDSSVRLELQSGRTSYSVSRRHREPSSEETGTSPVTASSDQRQVSLRSSVARLVTRKIIGCVVSLFLTALAIATIVVMYITGNFVPLIMVMISIALSLTYFITTCEDLCDALRKRIAFWWRQWYLT